MESSQKLQLTTKESSSPSVVFSGPPCIRRKRYFYATTNFVE